MPTRRSEWEKALAAIFFPRRICVRCGGLSPGKPLCERCEQEMLQLRSCSRCATFLREEAPAAYRCADCKAEESSFVLARAALPYEGRLREQLLAFKYHGATGLRRPFAALLLQTWQRWFHGCPVDVCVPVPLAAQRQKERGYNQAELLTALLARELGVDHRPHLLRRVRETAPLAQQTRKERRTSMQGAFAAQEDVRGNRVLLVDDIYTTGATAEAASAALVKQGAAAVYVLTVAAGWDLPQPAEKEPASL